MRPNMLRFELVVRSSCAGGAAAVDAVEKERGGGWASGNGTWTMIRTRQLPAV